MPYAARNTPTGWVKVKTIPNETVVPHHKAKYETIAPDRALHSITTLSRMRSIPSVLQRSRSRINYDNK